MSQPHLIGLACDCHNAPSRFRNFLFSNHTPNYLSIPLYQGEEALDWAMRNNLLELATFISNHSSFVLVVGWTDRRTLEWANISNSTPEDILHAEMIIERFAPPASV